MSYRRNHNSNNTQEQLSQINETVESPLQPQSQENINAQGLFKLFKLFIERFYYTNTISISTEEEELICQIKVIISKYNSVYEFDELVDLFTLLLEDKDDLLLQLFKHAHTYTLMIYLIDCVVKKRWGLISGMYNISLCKTDHVDYINDLYEKENHMSMVINSHVFNNKFMHPKTGFKTEFEIHADHDSMFEMFFYDTSLNKHKNQPLGYF